jgi:hypothetical protein
MIQCIPAAVLGLAFMLGSRESGRLPSLQYLWLDLPSFAGALWVRRRATVE